MSESLYHRPNEFWRVGIANDPKPEDKIYDREEDAIAKAASMASAQGYYTPVAVWDCHGDPVWLFMLGYQFRRV